MDGNTAEIQRIMSYERPPITSSHETLYVGGMEAENERDELHQNKIEGIDGGEATANH